MAGTAGPKSKGVCRLIGNLLGCDGPRFDFRLRHYCLSYGWVCGFLMGRDKIEVIKANSFFAS
jgi:hypothetical protein